MPLEAYRKTPKEDLYEFLNGVENRYNFNSSKEKSGFLNALLTDLAKQEWDEKLQVQALSVIRTLSRNPIGSDPIYTKEAVISLSKLAGIQSTPMDTPVSREALKVIANSIYLNDECKIHLEQEGVIDGCLRLIKQDPLSLEAQFLGCRILFFMTISRPDLVHQLIQNDIATPIEKILTRQVDALEKQMDREGPINPSTVMSEALKLLFNLLLVDARSEDQQNACVVFKQCLVPIYRMLFDLPFPKPQPLIPPHSQCFHAMMQFPYDISVEVWRSQKDWISQKYNTVEEGGRYVVNRFVDVLDQALHALLPSSDPDHGNVNHLQADAAVAPVLLVLANIIEACPYVIPFLATKMLPNQTDRSVPVNEGSSLSAYLIRLMTSTMMPQSRSAVCEVLFILCNKDAGQLVQQVGYGNAAGYLVNKGIAMDLPQGQADDDSQDINPITGQYTASESKGPDLSDMTDEEKEREAERLFVLFERLKKTGIIDVENPIAKAMRENQGRFEEVENDSDDD